MAFERKYTDEQYQHALAMLEGGATIADAAAEAGISTGALESYRRKAKAKQRKGAGGADLETLDLSAAPPTDAPERAEQGESAPRPRAPRIPPAKGGKGARSLLGPFAGQVVDALTVGLYSASVQLTAGKAPLTPAEAQGIVRPAVRLADRHLGKYVSIGAGNNQDARDVAEIVGAIVMYVLRRLTTRAGGQGHAGASAPVRHAGAAAPGTPTPAATTAAEGDLFAGSEPVAPAPVPVGAAAPLAGLTGMSSNGHRPGAADAIWNAISPPDLGAVD